MCSFILQCGDRAIIGAVHNESLQEASVREHARARTHEHTKESCFLRLEGDPLASIGDQRKGLSAGDMDSMVILSLKCVNRLLVFPIIYAATFSLTLVLLCVMSIDLSIL